MADFKIFGLQNIKPIRVNTSFTHSNLGGIGVNNYSISATEFKNTIIKVFALYQISK